MKDAYDNTINLHKIQTEVISYRTFSSERNEGVYA